jgi:hypothetical protein
MIDAAIVPSPYQLAPGHERTDGSLNGDCDERECRTFDRSNDTPLASCAFTWGSPHDEQLTAT